MQIIDKNKDFYDYFSYVYGVDKTITFDRRGSTIIYDESIFLLNNKSYLYLMVDRKTHFILEVGNIQYLIEMYDIEIERNWSINEFKSCKLKILHTFSNHTHYFDSVMSIREVDVKTRFNWSRGDFKREPILSDNFRDTVIKIYDNYINLPILKETQLTKVLDPEEIWKELQNYISALNNDKEVDIEMTDVEKAEIHGFDRKTSFRHPIK